MVLNAAVQALRQADELKQKVQNYNGNDSILQDRTLWIIQQELQKVYQRILVLDLDYALDKKVEQDLWTIGFKHQIEALQSVTKDRKNPRRSEAQAMLAWVLQSAAGYYLCLLHQICTTFKLDLPFRRRASVFGEVVSWGAGGAATNTNGVRRPAPASCRYICQHCLVHLGDLARYRHQLRVADSFYRHALAVSTSSGQPYNQLALLEASRGDRLAALYYHVRSLAVRSPFPPARGNLARTLAAAANSNIGKNSESDSVLVSAPISSLLLGEKISPHQYITELIRFHHLLKTNERLDIASLLVSSLTSTLTALVGTDSFDSATIVKMTCINMFAATGGLHDGGELSPEDPRRLLALQLAGGQLAALLLPARVPLLTYVGLPSIKILLEWVKQSPTLLSEPAFVSKLQLWPALCKVLNDLQCELGAFNCSEYLSVPLPEDEELHGFLPIDKAFVDLKFTNLATPDAFGYSDAKNAKDVKQAVSIKVKRHRHGFVLTKGDADLTNRLRASRIIQLGTAIADCQSRQKCQFFKVSVNENATTFSHVENALESNPELLKAIERLKIVPDVQESQKLPEAIPEVFAKVAEKSTKSDKAEGLVRNLDTAGDVLENADEKIVQLTPVIISEADFREKVREKRVGILKPQGSLERAREERALATESAVAAPSEPQVSSSISLLSDKDEDTPSKKEGKRSRMNVAMQAIMRKQEEINKQVKFITPASTPDSTPETYEQSPQKDDEKTKIVHPKAIKSLANLPLDRKTGGILSLKDKSAGYPHLVNAEAEKSEPQHSDEEKNAPKLDHTNSMFGYQYPNFVPKEAKMQAQPQLQPQIPWSDSQFQAPKNQYPTLNQKPGLYGTATNINSQGGLRLPVVNPKEIDVRSAALQKQTSRGEQFFGGDGRNNVAHNNHQWQGDKLLFMNDLPPRFANQFRNNPAANNMPGNGWPTRDNHLDIDRKYESGPYPSQINMPSWDPPPTASETPPQPPSSWWKPSLGTSFDPNYPTGEMQSPSYYMQGATNLYPNLNSYSGNPVYPQGYLGTVPSLQNLISSPNFTATLNNFTSSAYGQSQQPPITYDAAMYPQFGPQPKINYQKKNLSELHKQPMGVFQQPYSMAMSGLSHDRDQPMLGGDKRLSPTAGMPDYGSPNAGGFMSGLAPPMQDAGSVLMTDSSQQPGNTYSLFSGGQETTPWTASSFRSPPSSSSMSMHQSLWSGDSPLALERLLEQQKQLKKQNPE